ncbi:hypothetical protein [Psychromonas sp. GE-S-Ul-11]|uniref:hypothetical protein n=1 Tax=Psychromonas sp. GE-S-Ul-11 TaxID=3241170 RepID=UPI00390C92A6
MRKGLLDIDELIKLYKITFPSLDLKAFIPDGMADENYGGWFDLACLVNGAIYKVNKVGGCEHLLPFLNYVTHLCHTERDFIGQCRKEPSSISEELTNDYIAKWLLLDNFQSQDLENKPDEKIKYNIAKVLSLVAIFEVLIALVHESDLKSHFIFEKYLPKLCEKGKLIKSNTLLLKIAKERWEKQEYSGKVIKSTVYYRDIVKAQNPGSLEHEVDPDISRIKKQFQRWLKPEKKGNTLTYYFITIDKFRKDINVLFMPYETDIDFDDEIYTACSPVYFLQIFQRMQNELTHMELSPQFIVDQFSRYPLYVESVKSRFYQHLKIEI